MTSSASTPYGVMPNASPALITEEKTREAARAGTLTSKLASPLKLTRWTRAGPSSRRPLAYARCGRALAERSMSQSSDCSTSRARGPASVQIAHCVVTGAMTTSSEGHSH